MTTVGFRLRAACGIAGPAAFTAAWVAGTLRQSGYSVAEEHLSGLAAPDARDPELMLAGFLALGVCTTAFGGALRDALGGPGRAGPGPWLVRCAGMATVAAGLLRRDRMLLHPPGGGAGASWHNQGHDLASGVAYAALLAAPLLLAARFGADPAWGRLRALALATSLVTAALLAVFWSEVLEPWNGIVQRVVVTIPLAFMAALAVHLLAQDQEPAGRRPPG